MTSASFSLTSCRIRAALTGVWCASVIALATNAAAASTTSVDIDKFAFAPKEIIIAPGTTVVWTNHDATPHTIAASDKSFVSKGLDTDDKYEHTFEAEGDFTYVCTLHPFMTGTVHVRKK
jgi:plastocyanin